MQRRIYPIAILFFIGLALSSCGDAEQAYHQEQDDLIGFCTQLFDESDESKDSTLVVISTKKGKEGQKAATDLRAYKWEQGQQIKVHFYNASADEKSFVLSVANEWSKICNLSFILATSKFDAEIRIEAGSDAYRSYVGKPKVSSVNRPTMWLGIKNQNQSQEKKRALILHEFGHAIGLIHEHQRADAGIPWHYDSVYAYYERTLKWDQKHVDENVLNLYKFDQYNGTTYDSKSIMHYYIPRNLTTKPFMHNMNFDLSELDKSFVNSIYPK